MANNQTGGNREVGAAAEPCPLRKCSVVVQVMRQDTREYLGGLTAKLTGPTPGSGQTAEGSGTKIFDPVEPGDYQLQIVLEGKSAQELRAPPQRSFNVNRGEEKVVLVELTSTSHWIEIVLTDDVGRPRAGERYRLLLPDRQTKEGVLDAKGRVRVDGLEAGSCKVSFPELDPDAWEKV